jgi:hypothetical protein
MIFIEIYLLSIDLPIYYQINIKIGIRQNLQQLINPFLYLSH